MPMTMSGTIELAASRATVWDKLNDPDTLKSCIPGCEELNLLSDHEFEADCGQPDRPREGQVQGARHFIGYLSDGRLSDFR